MQKSRIIMRYFLFIKKSLKISHEETGILINLKNLRCYSTTYIEHN